MAKVIGKIVCPNGKYIKDDEEKTRWLHCGVLLQTDKGMRIKLESLPVARPLSDDGGLWLQVFEESDAQKQEQGFRKPNQDSARGQNTAKPDPQDDIPF